MGVIKWYKRDPSAALNGMMELSLEERGAYNTVLDLIYSRDGKLPDDDRFISGWMMVDVRVWKRIKATLISRKKLYVEDGFIRNERADVEVAEALLLRSRIRPSIPMDVKRLVIARDGHKCAYCGTEVGPFQFDHIYPWSRGGSDTANNLCVACAPCNRAKSDKTPDEMGWTQ